MDCYLSQTSTRHHEDPFAKTEGRAYRYRNAWDDWRRASTSHKKQYSDIAVIGISAFLDSENEKRYGAQWSDAFYAIIPKEIPTIQLVRAIGKATGNGEVALWTGKSIDSMRLSGKELQIIANYARGFTTSTIARQLNISEASVKTYARRAFEKLHVHSRAEAVAVCVRNGWI